MLLQNINHTIFLLDSLALMGPKTHKGKFTLWLVIFPIILQYPQLTLLKSHSCIGWTLLMAYGSRGRLVTHRAYKKVIHYAKSGALCGTSPYHFHSYASCTFPTISSRISWFSDISLAGQWDCSHNYFDITSLLLLIM